MGRSLIQSDSGRIVGKCDTAFVECHLDTPVGLGADFELLARRRLNLTTECLDTRIDAVKLGLERHIDAPGELRVFEHLEPDLLHQFSDALTVDGYWQRDFEFVDHPIARIVANATERTVGDKMQRPVLMAQCECAKRDPLDDALRTAALDIVADAEHILDQIARAAERRAAAPPRS